MAGERFRGLARFCASTTVKIDSVLTYQKVQNRGFQQKNARPAVTAVTASSELWDARACSTLMKMHFPQGQRRGGRR